MEQKLSIFWECPKLLVCVFENVLLIADFFVSKHKLSLLFA